jgi:hypothetical protein
MRLSIICPCCGSRTAAVKTKQLSKVFTEATYRCSNIECNFSFVAGVEILRALNLSPFTLPEELGIPLSKHIDRRKLIKQLESAPEAPELKCTDSAPVQLANYLVSKKKEKKPAEPKQPNTWHGVVTSQAPARTEASAVD